MRNDIFHHSPNTTFNGLSSAHIFNDPNACSGSASEITPQFMLRLGNACSSVSKHIAISTTEHSICKLLLYSFLSSAAANGAKITETDADFCAVSAFSASVFKFDLTVFIENDANKLRIRFFDKDGFPISKELQKKIALKFSENSFAAAAITDILLPKNVSGTKDLFTAHSRQLLSLNDLTVSVRGKSSPANTLKQALSMSGCRINEEERGILLFDTSPDGLKLRVRDENEFWHDEAHIASLIAYIFFSKGGKTLVTDATSPSVMEQIATDFGGKVLRLGRDKKAPEIFKKQNIMKNAISNAIYLCSHLFSTKETLFNLIKKLPDFILVSREVHIKSDKQHILSQLSGAKDGFYKENADSLRICTDGGWINIVPSRTGHALQITAESFNEEIASELCDLYTERASTLDRC